MESFDSVQSILAISLWPAITLRIIEMKERGGPSEVDRQRAQEASNLLGEHGDLLMFSGKPRKGGITTAKVFNETSHAIAVLSFCPGGVTVFNNTYDASTINFGAFKKVKPRKRLGTSKVKPRKRLGEAI